MPSSTPATPPRRRPLARARSSSSSPAIPRRRRWAAKSKEPSGGERGFRSRPRRSTSSPTPAPAGSLAQRGTRTSRRPARRRPLDTPNSTEEPKADGRGGVSRWPRSSTVRPSETSVAGRSSASSRMSPSAAPDSTSAAHSTPSATARHAASRAKAVSSRDQRPSRRGARQRQPHRNAADRDMPGPGRGEGGEPGEPRRRVRAVPSGGWRSRALFRRLGRVRLPIRAARPRAMSRSAFRRFRRLRGAARRFGSRRARPGTR